MTERRTRRSQVHAEALALFLESQRGRLAARAIAITTRDGKLLAASGPAPERLAKRAIEIHEARDDAGPTTTTVATWWLRAGGADVIVASDGGRLSYELGSGVKRILMS